MRPDIDTPDGSRRAIGRHYDLSDELFAVFLDETMTYSSALFPLGVVGGGGPFGTKAWIWIEGEGSESATHHDGRSADQGCGRLSV